MTEQEQRIAIAKWMGTYVDDIVSGLSCVSVLPNFVHDLNAIHEAEGNLWNDETLVEKYQENLQHVYLKSVGYQGSCYWFMAGAKSRAEALLRTLNLWTD